MLVDDIKAMESPERVIPSLVWVEIPDRIYNFLPHALYFSCKSGFEFRGRDRPVENWELDLLSRLVPISSDKCASEMIESGAEIVDSVSSNAKEREGGTRSALII